MQIATSPALHMSWDAQVELITQARDPDLASYQAAYRATRAAYEQATAAFEAARAAPTRQVGRKAAGAACNKAGMETQNALQALIGAYWTLQQHRGQAVSWTHIIEGTQELLGETAIEVVSAVEFVTDLVCRAQMEASNIALDGNLAYPWIHLDEITTRRWWKSDHAHSDDSILEILDRAVRAGLLEGMDDDRGAFYRRAKLRQTFPTCWTRIIADDEDSP